MPSSRGLTDSRIKPVSSAFQVYSLLSEQPGKPGLWDESESEGHSVVSDSLRPHGLYSPWNSPGQNTGVGSLSLLQGIFPIQGSNPGLLHCRRILYQLSHKGSPRILEWVAYPFSRGSSQPSSQTGVSCIAARFFTNWAIRDIFISLINTRYIPDISAIYQVSLWDNQSISGIYRDIPDISEKYQVYQGYQGYTRYIPDISQISLWDNQAQISPLTLGPTSTGWLSLWRGSLNIGKMIWRQRVVWNIYKPGNTRGC